MKLVFDFGGVLFQWRPPELLKREIPQRAHDDASAAHWVDAVFQGYEGDWGEFDRGTCDAPALVQRIARRTGLAEHEARAIVDGVPNELQPKPDSVALLRRLRDAGAPLYFLSNMPAAYADHLEAAHDFVGWFRDGVFSARVQAIKPEPAIFELASRRFGVPPSSLLFFDDHLPNVQAAQAAGWQAVHFTGVASAEAALRTRGLWPDAERPA
jgi:putative hydrolase of the HAD superfamily